MRQGENNRRRLEDKPAVVAELVLDEPLEGEGAILSDDLRQDLFPGDASSMSFVVSPAFCTRLLTAEIFQYLANSFQPCAPRRSGAPWMPLCRHHTSVVLGL
jgi:hypothetical protein